MPTANLKMKRRLFATLMATLLLERWAGRLLAAQRGGKGVAKKKIVVIGAGMSGLAAARVLHDQGQDVLMLEGRDRLGGRLWTSNKWPDMPVDLGASWIHGTQDNPLTSLADKAKAKQCETSYERSIAYRVGGQELGDAAEQQLDRLRSRLGKALRAAQNAEQDVSIRQFVTALAKQMDADAETIRLLNFIVSSEIEQEYAGSAERLSTHWYDSAEAFEGEDVLLAQGFQIIVQHLAKGLSIRTNEIVRRVDWSQSAIKVVTESGSFQADKVLLTLPVGVLKAGSVEIVPPLPPAKVEAISKLEMGVLNKCCLRFSRVFWPADVDWLQYIPSQDGMWTEWVSFARALEQPILLGFTSGHAVVNWKAGAISRLCRARCRRCEISLASQFRTRRRIKSRAGDPIALH